MDWNRFIEQALKEDIGEGDHTSLSCVNPNAVATATLHIKDNGILAGLELAENIFRYLDPETEFSAFFNDGDKVSKGTKGFEIKARALAILTGERLALNCMQRMSGIATLTNKYVKLVEDSSVKILDTRKTTPLFRAAEKWAVKIGGGENHRFGLYDMILIKDNHIDYCGGIVKAITSVKEYLVKNNLQLKVEIEARTLADVELILTTGGVDRILLDNFSIGDLQDGVTLISDAYETEASGGVTLETVRDIAATGVNYISVGALTHSYRSLDLSLKAKIVGTL